MKLVKILLVLAVIAGIAYFAANMADRGGEGASKKAGDGEGGVRLEEKYGFTGETALP